MTITMSKPMPRPTTSALNSVTDMSLPNSVVVRVIVISDLIKNFRLPHQHHREVMDNKNPTIL